MGYEYVRIETKRHLVCAKCRHPLIKGHNPPYPLPEPGMPVLSELMKQSVCGPCYKEMYAFMYPEAPVPDIFDGKLPNALPVPWDKSQAPLNTDVEDYDKWEQALMEARASGGAETVEQSFHRLWTGAKPDVSMTGITENINT